MSLRLVVGRYNYGFMPIPIVIPGGKGVYSKVLPGIPGIPGKRRVISNRQGWLAIGR